MTHNREQAQHEQDELIKDAQKLEICKVLSKHKVPVPVSTIVKASDIKATVVRERLFEMMEEGKVKEILWRYTL